MLYVEARAERLCDEIAVTQHGVLSRDAALGCGMSARGIERRVESGRWRLVAPGVYVPRPVPVSWKGEAMAGVLWGGPYSLASHRTAARLWGLIEFIPDRIEIVGARSRDWPGVIAHRLRPEDCPVRAQVGPIPVTTVERTLLDLAGVISPRILGFALDEAVRRAGTTYQLVAAELARTGGRGRKGTKNLREALLRRDPRDPSLESRLEGEILELILDAGLPPPTPQYRVRDGNRIVARLDFAYPEHLVGIEVHGYRFHSPHDRWDLDQERENRLKLMGWTILVFSWEAVTKRPERVIATIRAALPRQLFA